MSDIQKAAISLTTVGGTVFIGAGSYATVMRLFGYNYWAPRNVVSRRIVGGSLLSTSIGTFLFAVDNAQNPTHSNELINALKTTGIVAIGFGIGELGVGAMIPMENMLLVSGIFFAGGALMIGIAESIGD